MHNVGLDDYFTVAALAVAIGMGVMNDFHVSLGTGYFFISFQCLSLLTGHRRHGADLDLATVLVPTLKH